MIYMASKLVEVREDMERIFAVHFTNDADKVVPEPDKTRLELSLQDISKECAALGLQMTVLAANRFLQAIHTAKGDELFAPLADLQERFTDEVALLKFIYVSAEKMTFYDQAEAFGNLVSKAFPSADYDIREAGNCFALERHTATVMHSMRVLESGLDALGRSLKVRRSTRGWGIDLKIFQDRWDSILKTKP